ncbi:MAG: hypothetical protein LDL41_10355 [Coleofasciculus sp. S288]|nr:hypothetical protein [Coleofasciculus sp. S288]
MDRRIGVHSLLLITVLSFAGVPLAIASVSFPASSILEESAAIRQTYPKSLWDWLFGKKRGSGGSRTPFCSLWPHKDDQDLFEIWSDKPLFVWKVAKGVTSAKRLEVRLPDSESTVWSHDLTANEPDVHTQLYSAVISDTETRGHGDTGTRRHGDTGTRGHGDTGTRRHGDTGTRGHRR